MNQDKLISDTTALIKSYLTQVHNRDRKVVNFHEPDLLREKFDFDITHEWTGTDELLSRMQDIADLSVANQHPRFFSALRWGADIYGIMWEWLTAVMGTTMYTYEVAPLFTLMEEYIFDMIAEYLWRSSGYDGMMLPWWTMSNLHWLQLARYALDNKIHEKWMYDSQPLVILTSDQSHYSITKSAMLMGIGKQNVIKVATNDVWEMDIIDLETKIKDTLDANKIPLMINATSGTTVLWAFDNIQEISIIAKKYNIRLHVDATRWWSIILVDQMRHNLEWVEHADSYSRNPHKMMWAPIQCSIFMTQHTDQNLVCNTLKSPYLFNEDKIYDGCYDTGDKYIQCGRKVDVLKLRLQWKARWRQGIADNIKLAFDHAAYLTDKIKNAKHLVMVQDPDCLNVCFRYIPNHLADKNITRETVWDYYDEIHTLTAKIHAMMLQQGEMMTMFTNTKGLPNFFRLAIISPRVTHEDLDFVVEHIQELGKEVEKIS